MAPSKALAGLAARKRLLLAEAELHRFSLGADLHRLTAPIRWVDRVQPVARPAALVGVPLAGFLLTRNLPSILKWISRGWGVLRIVRGWRRKPKRKDKVRHR